MPGACVCRWHVPTDGEWAVLQAYITSQGFAGTEGAALKSTSGWANNGNGTDDFGFSALPGGNRDRPGYFTGAGYFGYWWSSSAWVDGAEPVLVQRSIHRRFDAYPRGGFSVRCLRDAE